MNCSKIGKMIHDARIFALSKVDVSQGRRWWILKLTTLNLGGYSNASTIQSGESCGRHHNVLSVDSAKNDVELVSPFPARPKQKVHVWEPKSIIWYLCRHWPKGEVQVFLTGTVQTVKWPDVYKNEELMLTIVDVLTIITNSLIIPSKCRSRKSC